MLQLVRRTLRDMQEGEIHDTVEGGFYRYATRADWSVPHHEKMLDSNAQRLHAYLEACQALGEESFRRTAQGILTWMHETLLDREDAARSAAARTPSPATRTSRRSRRGARARRAGLRSDDLRELERDRGVALLKAASVLRRAAAPRAGARDARLPARRALRRARGDVPLLGRRATTCPGCSSDQAYVLRALIDAVQFAGENRYLEPARRSRT